MRSFSSFDYDAEESRLFQILKFREVGSARLRQWEYEGGGARPQWTAAKKLREVKAREERKSMAMRALAIALEQGGDIGEASTDTIGNKNSSEEEAQEVPVSTAKVSTEPTSPVPALEPTSTQTSPFELLILTISPFTSALLTYLSILEKLSLLRTSSLIRTHLLSQRSYWATLELDSGPGPIKDTESWIVPPSATQSRWLNPSTGYVESLEPTTNSTVHFNRRWFVPRRHLTSEEQVKRFRDLSGMGLWDFFTVYYPSIRTSLITTLVLDGTAITSTTLQCLILGSPGASMNERCGNGGSIFPELRMLSIRGCNKISLRGALYVTGQLMKQVMDIDGDEQDEKFKTKLHTLRYHGAFEVVPIKTWRDDYEQQWGHRAFNATAREWHPHVLLWRELFRQLIEELEVLGIRSDVAAMCMYTAESIESIFDYWYWANKTGQFARVMGVSGSIQCVGCGEWGDREFDEDGRELILCKKVYYRETPYCRCSQWECHDCRGFICSTCRTAARSTSVPEGHWNPSSSCIRFVNWAGFSPSHEHYWCKSCFPLLVPAAHKSSPIPFCTPCNTHLCPACTVKAPFEPIRAETGTQVYTTCGQTFLGVDTEYGCGVVVCDKSGAAHRAYQGWGVVLGSPEDGEPAIKIYNCHGCYKELQEPEGREQAIRGSNAGRIAGWKLTTRRRSVDFEEINSG